jgi:hypothetical protein
MEVFRMQRPVRVPNRCLTYFAYSANLKYWLFFGLGGTARLEDFTTRTAALHQL